MKYLILLLVSFNASADLACDTTAHARFDDSQNFLGADFEPCTAIVMVPQEITIPGWSVDANGDLISINWGCPATRVEGEQFNCDTELAFYTVKHTSPSQISHTNTTKTEYKVMVNEEGMHTFLIRTTDNDNRQSEWMETNPKSISI